jgi:hypothetical protein
MYLKQVEREDAHNDNLFDMLQEIGSQENGFQNPAYGLAPPRLCQLHCRISR